MSKNQKNTGKRWSQSDLRVLKNLSKRNTPTGLMAYKLERSESAVRTKASDQGISLKPVNKSPYNRLKPAKKPPIRK